MAHYLVKAKAIEGKIDELKERLDDGEILPMRPFGMSLDYSLKNARQAEDGWVVWEEEDYCRPPLAMERTAVLDSYFTDLTVERVSEGDGWQKIQELPLLWTAS